MILNQSLSNITDLELLGSLIPKSAVKEMIAEYGSLPRLFANLQQDELQRVPGIGPVKAKQLAYICELSKRLYRTNNVRPTVIKSPNDVVNTASDIKYLAVETIQALYLNTRNAVLGIRLLSQGTIDSTIVSPREVFAPAVRLMAASVILIHNHPSGDYQPSKEDIELTRKMVAAGEILNVTFLDHIIVAASGYCSLKEKGLLDGQVNG